MGCFVRYHPVTVTRRVDKNEEKMGEAHCVCWKGRYACRIQAKNPEGKEPSRIQGYRFEDNIQKNVKEAVFDDAEWIHLA
jgi:hypothetical protein